MKDPVDHILRPALPWRNSAAITECGFDASKVKTLTRPEYLARLKELGRQRCAMLTCMTCAGTAARWGTWEDDPRTAIEREVAWEGAGRRWHDERGERLKDELIAIAALIDAHREEFDTLVTARERQREWLEKKAAMDRKPKAERPRGL